MRKLGDFQIGIPGLYAERVTALAVFFYFWYMVVGSTVRVVLKLIKNAVI